METPHDDPSNVERRAQAVSGICLSRGGSAKSSIYGSSQVQSRGWVLSAEPFGWGDYKPRSQIPLHDNLNGNGNKVSVRSMRF